VSAIVLNYEQSKQQKAHQWCEHKRDKVFRLDSAQEETEQQEERDKGECQLPSASAWPRVPKRDQLAHQLSRIERRDIRIRREGPGCAGMTIAWRGGDHRVGTNMARYLFV
jgi:hypothetical protein